MTPRPFGRKKLVDDPRTFLASRSAILDISLGWQCVDLNVPRERELLYSFLLFVPEWRYERVKRGSPVKAPLLKGSKHTQKYARLRRQK
jgi:hypothetical protein